MNQIYRTLFNRSLGLWQVAPETARARSKAGLGQFAAAILVALILPVESAWALCVWRGSATSSDWFDPENWSGGSCESGIPTSADMVEIYASQIPVVIDGGDAESWILWIEEGSLTIRNGGTLASSALPHTIGGPTLNDTELLITGAGSTWNVIGGEVRIGYSGRTTLILADGGSLNASGGLVTLGQSVSSLIGSGTLVIGARVGEDAVAPGFLDTAEIDMGRGDDGSGTLAFGLIVFNHTDNSGGYTFAPDITGNGRIEHYSGTTLVTGSNDYTGGTLLRGGVLAASADEHLGDTAGGLTFDGGILRVAGTGFTQIDRDIVWGDAGGGFDIADPGNNFTVDNDLTGIGGLIKQGEGTLTLLGNNSYSGPTVVETGNLLAGSAGAFAQGGVYAVNGGTLDLNGFNLTMSGLTGDGTVALGSGDLTLNSDTDTIFDGDISGSGYLIKQGGGALSLTGDNQVRLFEVQGGTLRLDGGSLDQPDFWIDERNSIGGAPGDDAALVVANGGVLTAEDYLYIGRDDGTTGNLTITGEDSIVTLGRFIVIGEWGEGSVIVEEGGRLNTSYGAYVGGGNSLSQGTGTLLVTGAGSVVDLSGNLRIATNGDGARGAVTLTDSGELRISTRLILGTNNATGDARVSIGADMADSAAAPGTLVVPEIQFRSHIGSLNFNHTGTDYHFDSLLVSTSPGAGAINHYAGTTTLNGNSEAFAGETTVVGGTLRVNGFLGGAVTVEDGATLGGSGTVGATLVESGGILAPGNSTGTLTVDGDLTLAQGSVLDFEFGAPGVDFNTPGDSDSITATGDLALNGATLNVIDDGDFGPGLYRLFDYGGTLSQSNGGLDLGATPSGTTLSLQFLTDDQQINLLNTGDTTLDFWNANGFASEHQMGGGDGTWSVTSPVWTDGTGSITAAMQPQPGFAIFGGEAGTVTLDNSEGEVTATGLQFVADGYRLTGAALHLTGGNEIRVGDGGAGSESWSAIIDSEITGSEGLTKSGAGTLVLTGANNWTGGTVLAAGTLRAGSAGAFAQNSAYTIHSDATLDINGFDLTLTGLTGGGALALGGGELVLSLGTDTTFAGTFAGTGNLIQQGSTTVTLVGDSGDFTGHTQVQAGTLLVNGTLGGAVTVEQGAALGGSGVVGALQLDNGAVISPGNSIGSLTVDGDLSFSSGATYVVEVDPQAGDSDHIQVGGVARLNGASIQHIGENSGYQPFSRYTILTAEGGVEGEFGAVSSAFAFLTPQLDYDEYRVYLELLRNDVGFGTFARTANQRAVAENAEGLASDHPVYQRVVTQSEDTAAQLFERLSGDSLLAGLNAGRELQRQFGAELRRQSSPMGGRSSLASIEERRESAGGVSSWLKLDSTRFEEEEQADVGNAHYRLEAQSLTAGVDVAGGERWLLGAAITGVDADLRYRNRTDDGDVSGYALGFYGRWRSEGALYLRSDGVFGRYELEHRRYLEEDVYDASTTTNASRLSVEAGLDIHWRGLDWRPYLQLAGEHLTRGVFTESGQAEAALSVSRTRVESAEVSLGLDLGRSLLLGGYWTQIQLGTAAVQGVGDTQARQEARFQAGDEPFSVGSADLNDLQMAVSLSAEAYVYRSLSVWAGYRARFGNGGDSHGGQLGAQWRW